MFVPLRQEVAQNCWKECYRTYCTLSEARAATIDCLMKLSTGYCAVFEDQCWRLKEVGSDACYRDEQQCQEPVGQTCSWYRNCLESAHECGPDGYAIQYGLRYCNRFRDHEQVFSPAGRKWMYQTR